MVLVKCLQMPRGQGSTVAQVFNYQFQGMLRYFISDSTAPPEHAIAQQLHPPASRKMCWLRKDLK